MFHLSQPYLEIGIQVENQQQHWLEEETRIGPAYPARQLITMIALGLKGLHDTHLD